MPTSPERLGKYLIRRRLGAGAMGVVYEGFDPLIERSVALKVIRQETFDHSQADELRTRLKREAQAAGRLAHPGIVAVFEYGEGEAGTEAFIAMEMVHGRELKAALDAGERFGTDAVARILRGVLGALQHAHDRGVVHRDIKPGNVFLLPDGGVKVADFGIARIEASDLTQTGAVIGTPSYMAPEQLLGQAVDGRADLFACGVLLYQLLTGERPFTGSIATVMQKVLNEDPAPPSAHRADLAPHWDAVVRRALAKPPAERFQSADEFAAAIAQAATIRPLPAPHRSDDEKTVILPKKPASPTLPPTPSITTLDPLPPPPAAGGGFVQEEVPRTVPMPRTPGSGTRGAGGVTGPVPLDSLPPQARPAPPPLSIPVPPPPALVLPPAPRPGRRPRRHGRLRRLLRSRPVPAAAARPPAAPPVVPRTVPVTPPLPAAPASRKTAVAAAARRGGGRGQALTWWADSRGDETVTKRRLRRRRPVLPPPPGVVVAGEAPAPDPGAAGGQPDAGRHARASAAATGREAARGTHPRAATFAPSGVGAGARHRHPRRPWWPVAQPPPPPAAPARPWIAARERLDNAPAAAGLAGALRALLDVQDAKGRQTLADFERFVNALPEHSALAFGVRDGQLRMRWQFRAGSGAVAAEMALRRCAEAAGRPCALVSSDADFRKPALQEVARQFGMADVASVRMAFVQTLASSLHGWRESIAAPPPAAASGAPAPYAAAPSPAPASSPAPAAAAPARAASDWAGAQARLRGGEAPRALGGALAVLLQAQAEEEVDTLNRFDSAVRRLRYSSAVAMGERGGSIVFGYAHGESRGNWAEERAVAACSGIGAQGCTVVWVNGSTRAAELAALAGRLESHSQSSVRHRFVELLRVRLSKGL